MTQHRHARLAILAIATALGAYAAAPALAQQPAPTPPQPARNCPQLGWEENLGGLFQQPDSVFPYQDTDPAKNPMDCNFHQWSYEAFVWATTLNAQGVPRFMTLPTEEDLFSTAKNAGTVHRRTLQLAARSIVAEGLPGYTEGAGAFVQADGKVLVAPSGYPVYTSVHMNQLYFDTAKKNLIATKDYQKGDPNETFPEKAAVFKATWLRLAPGADPPLGAFVTNAQVPVLTVVRSPTGITIQPVAGKFVSAKVALVGLHVVGVTVGHPEFVWGTFEHKLDAPQVPDNTFSPGDSSPTDYTLYKAGTSYGGANIAFGPPLLTFNTTTQRFSPVTQAVQENQTGGETDTYGAGNVWAVNGAGQRFFAGEKGMKGVQPQQYIFGNYNLVGTVWMDANSYNTKSDQTNAVGSVNLANTTAETFEQFPTNTDKAKWQNCFSCHNAGDYSYQANPLTPRLVAISHVLAVGTEYAIPNMVSGELRMLFKKP